MYKELEIEIEIEIETQLLLKKELSSVRLFREVTWGAARLPGCQCNLKGSVRV